MRRRDPIAATSSSWRRSWAVSLAFFLAIASCTGTEGSAPTAPQPQPEVTATLQGWMGGYSRREAELAELLGSSQGWVRLRDMELFEALQAFSGSDDLSDRLGAARACLELAGMFEALDRLYLRAEGEFLESESGSRARRGFVRLRSGDLSGAGAVFAGEAPEGQGFVWAVGRAAASAAAGKAREAQDLIEAAPAPAGDAERVLGQAVCFLWGLACGDGGKGPYGQALSAFRRGDLAEGVLALQMLDFGPGADTPEPGLFLYPLQRRAFAGLALSALGDAVTPEEAFLAGNAHLHLGDLASAADLFQRAAQGNGTGSPAAWIYSPYHGLAEAAGVSRALLGEALYRSGRKADALEAWRGVLVAGGSGALAIASLAALQVELGAAEPLGDPVKAAAASLAAVREASSSLPAEGEHGELLSSLYPARLAAVSRLAARVQRGREGGRGAVGVLEPAHRKSLGFRPDFANPPAFLVDLSGAYAEAGEYAPAVSVLFELTRDYPSARLAYESLKRLYASHTGGEVPPR